MTIKGTVEYFTELLESMQKPKKKQKQLKTVDLKVRMDCEGCERKVKNALSSLKGVQNVEIDMKQQKASVTGYVDPKKVMKKAKSTGKKVEPWPYVPYNLVMHPYSFGTYDKKAPPGFVRATESYAIPSQASREEDELSNMFNDENPNACSIM